MTFLVAGGLNLFVLFALEFGAGSHFLALFDRCACAFLFVLSDRRPSTICSRSARDRANERHRPLPVSSGKVQGSGV